MDADPLHAVLTVVVGVATGILSASLGVGGAMLSTPAIRLLGVTATYAVATTLPALRGRGPGRGRTRRRTWPR